MYIYDQLKNIHIWMIIIRLLYRVANVIYNHPTLDVSCHQYLDESHTVS